MNTKIVILFFSIITSLFAFNSTIGTPQQKEKPQDKTKEKTATVKDNKDNTKVVTDTLKSRVAIDFKETDTLQIDPNSKLKVYKKSAHASYYHNKFNGRRTASGKRFDNNKYTAAHKKLPFGTIVKVTNEANGKSVVVEITDRGPFSKVREIDLSRRAFMDIASNKNSGSVIVKIEIVEPKK
ncbi:septal ring lytic transglycosylase RlpA family protein [Flavobacterium terrisoli]|uniref:septal ring lytic transglycosylase RlpA family protein n=1 Tax=Flavobacterium terrisoli TaxID=3242195 RepID=UPI00355620DA